MTDGQLLARYAREGDGESFRLLLERHGAMVLAACRRRAGPEAEDAAQAVFVLLARKAGRLTSRRDVGPWLYRTAAFVCGHAVRARERRRTREKEAAEMRQESLQKSNTDEKKELRRRLDAALNSLPGRYREVMVLCYLQGASQSEAARRLGLPAGTVAARCARGMAKLRGRLSRRGVTLGAAALAGALAAESAQAALPAGFVSSTLAAATGGGPVASSVTALAKGGMQAMTFAKIKIAAAVLCAATIVGGGGGFVAVQGLSAGEPKATPKKLNPKLAALAENSWVRMNPKPLKRKRPTSKDTNSPLKEVVSGEPVFREYSSPVYGGGRIYYFGGMHSGYPGNDMEVYDVIGNVWKQSSYRLQCPPKGDPAYGSGGSENCWVNPKTGAGQPYSIHGYSRTSYHPGLRKYVCTATFPKKTRKNPKTGKWELAAKGYGLISYDHRTDKWELLAEAKPGDLTQWDSALGGFLAVHRNRIWLFKDGKWKLHDTAKVSLSRSGGSASVYMPDRKSHVFALMPHGGAKEWGKLYAYNSARKEAKEIISVPAELRKRFVPLGNFVMAYDPANRKVVCMSADPDKVLVWIYDPVADKWRKLPQAPKSPRIQRGTFGPGSGREPLAYDLLHGVFFLVALAPGSRIQTWAYRYKRVKK